MWGRVALTLAASVCSPEGGCRVPDRGLEYLGGEGDGLQPVSESVHFWFSDVTVGAFMSDSVVLLR